MPGFLFLLVRTLIAILPQSKTSKPEKETETEQNASSVFSVG
jgi:hypothetical protein